ncbi:MAG: hemolysin III family protein [Clostridia bacterium]|nr:hemolysin III family protein [Clostridia bacterium]
MTEQTQKRLNIRIPLYTLGEEIFHAISHGIGAALSIAALAMMMAKAQTSMAQITTAVFGTALIMLYTISCVYHSLSRNLEGKKVMRVIDHCNVFLLVWGTYIPVALMGVGGALGWVLFGVTGAFTALGVTLTAIHVDKYKVPQVVCHLVSGWSILLGLPRLMAAMGSRGVLFLLLGGIMYTVGSLLYGLGARIRYMHSVFHVFCLLGSFCHFWGIYMYLL